MWGCFGVVLSSGINLIIVVTGVMTRCQRGYELRDALSTTNTWGLASEQHTAARGGDVKNEGYGGDERQSRGTEEQGSIIHGWGSCGIPSAIAMEIGRASTAAMAPVRIDTVTIDGGM